MGISYFACCSIFRIFQQSTHIAYFPHKLAFLTAIFILFVFLFPISFYYEMGYPVLGDCARIFLKMRHKTDVPS